MLWWYSWSRYIIHTSATFINHNQKIFLCRGSYIRVSLPTTYNFLLTKPKSAILFLNIHTHMEACICIEHNVLTLEFRMRRKEYKCDNLGDGWWFKRLCNNTYLRTVCLLAIPLVTNTYIGRIQRKPTDSQCIEPFDTIYLHVVHKTLCNYVVVCGYGVEGAGITEMYIIYKWCTWGSQKTRYKVYTRVGSIYINENIGSIVESKWEKG